MRALWLAWVVLTLAAPLRLAAQAPWDGTLRVALPLSLVDSLEGAKFKIQIPEKLERNATDLPPGNQVRDRASRAA